MSQIYTLEAQDFLSLPLYVLPDLVAWRTDQMTGPISAYLSSPLGVGRCRDDPNSFRGELMRRRFLDPPPGAARP